jgi:hypothetical protein
MEIKQEPKKVKSNGRQPNYKQKNFQTLQEIFPQLNEEILWKGFKENDYDLTKTIDTISEKNGIDVSAVQGKVTSTKEESSSKSEADDKKATFSVEEFKGDLFSSSPSASLAHCVSKDLRMGKGIAVEFKVLSVIHKNRFRNASEM